MIKKYFCVQQTNAFQQFKSIQINLTNYLSFFSKLTSKILLKSVKKYPNQYSIFKARYISTFNFNFYLKNTLQNSQSLLCYNSFCRNTMGSYRSQPQLSKHTFEMFSLDHSYAVTHMCGWRRYMEDASMVISPFTYKNYSLFGIFDGHGGPEVALFTQKHFPQQLQKNQMFKAGKFEQALKETFIHIDKMLFSQLGKKQIEAIRKNQVQKHNSSEQGSLNRIGCTSLVLLVTKDAIYIANAGDCRAVAVTYSGSIKQVTKDHKPHDADEQARIHKAGGYVQYGRVNGVLNLSRALGDLQFKENKNLPLQQQAISCMPDIIKIQRDDLFFIVMCCDGVWECKSSQSMGEKIRKEIEQRISLGKILQSLFDEIVAKDVKDDHGTDNMSAIIIKFDKIESSYFH